MRRFPLNKQFDDLVRARLSWEEELRHVFGDDALLAQRDARGMGEEGSELSRLFAARTEALIAWLASRDQIIG